MYTERKTRKLKLAGIALKQPQRGTETKETHGGVEVSCFYSIYLTYFELLHTIVTFPYTLIFMLLRNVI